MAGTAIAQEKPDSTLVFTEGSVAAGIGFSWGSGTLTYQGKEYPFSIDGLSVGSVGAIECHRERGGVQPEDAGRLQRELHGRDCPGDGRRRRRDRTRKGDRWLKITLLEAALATIRARGSALGARYRRICRHCGRKIAIVAVARAILEIVWHLLPKGTTYHELGAAYLDRRDKEQAARRYVRLLENLGHRVTLEPTPIAA